MKNLLKISSNDKKALLNVWSQQEEPFSEPDPLGRSPQDIGRERQNRADIFAQKISSALNGTINACDISLEELSRGDYKGDEKNTLNTIISIRISLQDALKDMEEISKEAGYFEKVFNKKL